MALIECMIRRKNGTEVTMGGKHPINQRHYHFKPIDPSNPRSPHVCEVENEDDFDSFMAIKEGYRRYKPDQPPAMRIAPPAPEPSIPNLRDRYDDVLSIRNVDELDNEWLAVFSNETLGIKSTDRAALVEHAGLYGIETKKSQPALQIIRLIIHAMIDQEKRGAAAAESLSKSDDSDNGGAGSGGSGSEGKPNDEDPV